MRNRSFAAVAANSRATCMSLILFAFAAAVVGSIIVAPQMAPADPASDIRSAVGIFMVLTIFFTFVGMRYCTGWDRAGIAATSLFITYVAAGMATMNTLENFGTVIVFALFGSALGSIAGVLLPDPGKTYNY